VEGILAATGQRLVVGCHALTSAPTLGGGLTIARVGDASKPESQQRQAVTRQDAQSTTPAIAILFAAGAALVVLGLVAWRRGLFERLAASIGRDERAVPLEPDEATASGDSTQPSAEARLAPLRLVEPAQEVELPLRG
jgi:hypothetical protein